MAVWPECLGGPRLDPMHERSADPIPEIPGRTGGLNRLMQQASRACVGAVVKQSSRAWNTDKAGRIGHGRMKSRHDSLLSAFTTVGAFGTRILMREGARVHI